MHVLIVESIEEVKKNTIKDNVYNNTITKKKASKWNNNKKWMKKMLSIWESPSPTIIIIIIIWKIMRISRMQV